MLKMADNPPVMYPENSEIESVIGRWWVAHTRSRHEKALAWNLHNSQIPYFLPLVERAVKRKGRIFKSLRPLFGGYIFFCGDEKDRYRALTTNRIAQVIEVVNQNGLIKELAQIHKALLGGAPLDPHPYLKSGDRCRVVAGPLIGLEGNIIVKKNRTRLLLQIEILGQAAALDIDADLLEPL